MCISRVAIMSYVTEWVDEEPAKRDTEKQKKSAKPPRPSMPPAPILPASPRVEPLPKR
jgi:hypothetical protein